MGSVYYYAYLSIIYMCTRLLPPKLYSMIIIIEGLSFATNENDLAFYCQRTSFITKTVPHFDFLK